MGTHVYRFSEFQTGLVESGQKRRTIRLRIERCPGIGKDI